MEGCTSTYKSFLMHKASTIWEKLIDITSYPDLGGDPEMLETTTLSDSMKTYIVGIQSAEGLEFETNYTLAGYKALKALEGKEEQYAVWFGGTGDDATLVPTGSEGKFSFKGQLSVYVTSGDTNIVRKMKIKIAPSTAIALDETTGS